MASTPASAHFFAKRLLETTCVTIIPSDFSFAVHVFGFPAEVKTMGTFSSMTISIIFSISGYISGIFTPKGLSVAFLHLLICSLSVSGCIDPAPINPKPPALLTAEASFQPLHHTIPP
jgi:hypothetical protein